MNISNQHYTHIISKLRIKFGSRQAGFTIVELMIALTILSIILVLSSTIFIQIGALYSKGLNGATLQNTTRNIVADVSATIEFSSSAPPSCTPFGTPEKVCAISDPDYGQFVSDPVYAYCIGTTRYTFVLGRELGTDEGFSPSVNTDHVLWRDTLKSPGTCVPIDLNETTPTDIYTTGTGYEMMANHMRLTKFIVEPTSTTGSVYSISVSTAFGDNDLLNNSQTNCKGGEGEQYCATSQISTSVIIRAPSQ